VHTSNTARGMGKCCKLPQWGLGRVPEERKSNSVHSGILSAFNRVCDWFESCSEDLYTLSELHEKMKSFIATDERATSPDELVYSLKHFKRKLKDR